jgi:hypothetical protein
MGGLHMDNIIDGIKEKTELNDWFLLMMQIGGKDEAKVMVFDLIKSLTTDTNYLKPAAEYHTFFSELAVGLKDEKKQQEILNFMATHLESGVV